MWCDVLDLEEFYASTLGQMTARLLRARLREVWPSVKGETVLGMGYATPLLRPFVDEAARTLAFMPAPQRVAAEQRPFLAKRIGDVAAGVAGHEEDIGLGLAEFVAIAVVDPNIDARDTGPVDLGADDVAARRGLDLEIAPDMVAMVVGIEDMGDFPAPPSGLGEDGSGDGRVHDSHRAAQRLARQPDVVVAQDRNANDFQGMCHARNASRAGSPRPHFGARI